MVMTLVLSCSSQNKEQSPKQVSEKAGEASPQAGSEGVAAEADELAQLPKAERDTLTVRLVEEFYGHAPKGGAAWDEAVLRRYLSAEVLAVLKDSVGGDATEGTQYATWLLTCVDEVGMVVPRKHNRAFINDKGICQKLFEVCYWGDGFLQGAQTLSYTVGGPLDHLQITHIDGLGDEAVSEVMRAVESRDEGRQIDAEMRKAGLLE